MKELQAKWVFEQGGFSKALVACAPMGTGYHLHLVKFGRQPGTELIELGVSLDIENYCTLRLIFNQLYPFTSV